MNQSTFSDITDALTLDFSVKVNGSKYSLQLKKKKKSYIIPPDSFGNDSHNFLFHQANNGGESSRGTKHIFYILEQICHLSSARSYKT